MLEPLRKNFCTRCDGAGPLCTACRKPDANETLIAPNGLMCTACALQFSLDDKKNTCEKCVDHCAYCGQNKECFVCEYGYFFYDNKCHSTRKIEGCDIASSPTSCSSCKLSYYLDQKASVCKRCHTSCLTCNGPNETNCISCSPEKYGLYLDESDLA